MLSYTMLYGPVGHGRNLSINQLKDMIMYHQFNTSSRKSPLATAPQPNNKTWQRWPLFLVEELLPTVTVCKSSSAKQQNSRGTLWYTVRINVQSQEAQRSQRRTRSWRLPKYYFSVGVFPFTKQEKKQAFYLTSTFTLPFLQQEALKKFNVKT